MENKSIMYCFRFPDETQEIFDLELDAHSLELVINIPESPPQWAELDFNKCPNCPLDSHTHPYCPLMLDFIDIVDRFDHILSYDEIRLEVVMDERSVSRSISAQKALSSLAGILITASGCPHTKFFKPMLRFHLPLSSAAETIYRAASMYLLAQYFILKEGKTADFELKGLEEIYNNMHLINVAIAERLRVASKTDALVNAIILLDVFTGTIPSVIEESLEELRYLFTPYLNLPKTEGL
ncbi:MAG: hypothetical protein JXA35_06870 [Deltaproteobacteria bacterium]|nr:hypothetical protein [Deltaproteobacteria bacterium]